MCVLVYIYAMNMVNGDGFCMWKPPILLNLIHIVALTFVVATQASPEGQKIFDKLLKACNEVEWKGESIRVLKEIRVDPPYKPENCSLIKSDGGGLDVHSLERVKKIVSAASAT